MRRGIRIVLANILDLGHSADQVIENSIGAHANEHKTSVMLAIDPVVVKMDRAVAEIQPWMQQR